MPLLHNFEILIVDELKLRSEFSHNLYIRPLKKTLALIECIILNSHLPNGGTRLVGQKNFQILESQNNVIF